MAYREPGFGYSFGYGLTPWVKRILIANVVMFLVRLAFPVIAAWLTFGLPIGPDSPLDYLPAGGG